MLCYACCATHAVLCHAAQRMLHRPGPSCRQAGKDAAYTSFTFLSSSVLPGPIRMRGKGSSTLISWGRTRRLPCPSYTKSSTPGKSAKSLASGDSQRSLSALKGVPAAGQPQMLAACLPLLATGSLQTAKCRACVCIIGKAHCYCLQNCSVRQGMLQLCKELCLGLASGDCYRP